MAKTDIKLPDYWLRRQSDYDVIPASVEEELAKILPEPIDHGYPEWWIEYGNGGVEGYEKHINKPYYELREDVSSVVYRHDFPEEDITYHIFGKFKTLRGAILSLVRKGNFTRDGRKAESFYH